MLSMDSLSVQSPVVQQHPKIPLMRLLSLLMVLQKMAVCCKYLEPQQYDPVSACVVNVCSEIETRSFLRNPGFWFGEHEIQG